MVEESDFMIQKAACIQSYDDSLITIVITFRVRLKARSKHTTVTLKPRLKQPC